MRKRFVAATGIVLATVMIGVSSASAATEFGDSCPGTSVAPGTYTLTTIEAPGRQITAPSAGVITKIRTDNGVPVPFGIPTSIKVLHPAGTGRFTTTAEDRVEIPNGPATTNVRLPVQAGDHIGLHGLPFSYEGTELEGLSVYCEGTGDGRRLGAAAGDVQLGQTADFPSPAEGSVPLVATVEPDADNDGYGDETQDLCPQSAVIQTACPVLILDALPLTGKGAITVFVASSIETTLAVTGKVGKAKLKKVTKAVAPGKLVRFKLKLTGSVKSALADLAPGKSLTAKIEASGMNAAGAVAKDKTKLKLK